MADEIHGSSMNSTFALRSLVSGHRNANASEISRIGSIIRKKRPSVIIDNGDVAEAALSPIESEIPGSTRACTEIVNAFSASVGRIEVDQGTGVYEPIGTCFRVGSRDKTCMATAGHLLKVLLGPGNEVTASIPFSSRLDMPAVQVNFHDNGQGGTAGIGQHIFAIDKWVWAHPRWDLLLFELTATHEQLQDRPPLPLENTVNQHLLVDYPICVIGYPMNNNRSSNNAFTAAFDGALNVKRVSPGLCNWPVASLPPATEIEDVSTIQRDQSTIDHDASTLPGSSGSPIFSLKSKKVIGLHYDGGEFHRNRHRPAPDPNNAVNIPAALLEPRLAAFMSGNPELAVGQNPIDWDPDLPRWSGIGTLEGQYKGVHSGIPTSSSPLLQSVVADRPDFRDRIYRSTLLDPKDELLPDPKQKRLIRNQHHLPACTAFALAATINAQLQSRKKTDDCYSSIEPVSEQMLYAMATLHDEWIDDTNGGSSLRGAIKGFYQNGVCLESAAPLTADGYNWSLSRVAALQARSITLGAYFRLEPKLLDFQIALNETGAVLVSAHIHRGWMSGTALEKGDIVPQNKSIGSHAFIIIGYDHEGFIIQNSWGENWGNWNNQAGLAHWKYDDWADNLIDAWVLRLAPSTPAAFDLVPRIANQSQQSGKESVETSQLPSLPLPKRFSLIGHVFQIERDRVLDEGRLGAGLDSLRETALFLGSSEACEKYPRIAFLFHDPLLGRRTISKLCAHMIEPFKRHGIYPIHIAYGTDEAHTIALRVIHECQEINRRFGTANDDLSVYIERRISQIMDPLIQVFLEGIHSSAQKGNPLWQVIASIVLETDNTRQYCAYASGIGFSIAEQLSNLAGVDQNSVDKNSSSEGNRLFANKLQSYFMLAPCANLAMIDNLKTANHTMVCTLAEEREPSISLPGYLGDWIDLTTRITGLDAKGTEATRQSKLTRQSPIASSAKSRTLHDACVEASVLNKCLSLFSQKSVSTRKGFR